jgi:hypothetical protein
MEHNGHDGYNFGKFCRKLFGNRHQSGQRLHQYDFDYGHAGFGAAEFDDYSAFGKFKLYESDANFDGFFDYNRHHIFVGRGQ